MNPMEINKSTIPIYQLVDNLNDFGRVHDYGENFYAGIKYGSKMKKIKW